ncbi:MAG: putative branched-chain amino acid transport ATP-binding protein LivG [Candidatus Heimdallarchaeota archaeon LC_2]|nr:MAG: putative branched-chain amino acid transport ATP-binding protein LivG [Candidatus Heimdallarchaeota archaeon LC_2]
MKAVLELKDVHKNFSGIKALQGVDIEIYENEIVGLIGPNGCGKSTTFNAISGVIPADSGSITLYGKEISQLKPNQINQRGLSRTYQNTRLWRELTVIENLLLPPKNQLGANFFNAIFRRRAFRKEERLLIEKAYDVLEILEVTHMADNLTSELSGGQSKLVDIGRVLMSDPKILLLDEPVAGVAGPLTEKIFNKIGELRDKLGITVVIVEHDMKFILRQGIDRIYVMASGQIIAKGTHDEIREKQEVIDAYLGD